MHFWKKALFVFAAMNLVGIAVALFLESGLGSDSIGLLCDGISHAIKSTFGNASLVYNLAMILVAFMVAKKSVGLGTAVYALFSGYFIDFYRLIFQFWNLSEKWFVLRAIAFTIGQLCLSLALAILIQKKLGMNALDAVLHKLQEKSNINYSILRTAADILYVVIGTVLGGTFGIGTICSVLLTGFMVGKWIALLQRSCF